MMRRAAIALALLAAPAAFGMPVERTLELKLTDLHFERSKFVVAAEVIPADLATVELFPTEELLVTPKKEGDGLLLLYRRGDVEGIRLHLGRTPAPGALDLGDVRKLCANVETPTQGGERYLGVTVNDEPCRAAVKRALEGDALPADHLRVSFTVAGIQAQLKALQTKVDEAGIAGATLAYAGATLRLEGVLSPAAHTRLLGILWREAVGHLDLDDQLTDPMTDPIEAPHAP